MSADPSFYRSFDTETHLIRPGAVAPPLVCGSIARVNGEIRGELLPARSSALEVFRRLLDSSVVVAYANAPFDLCVAAQADPSLFPGIFRALGEGRVHDVLISQALDAIYRGHLGTMADGSPLVSPSTGKESRRYSLEIVTHLVLGRVDAKVRDHWRLSYALLDGVPVEHWPEEARVYPVDDAVNTLEVALAQVFGVPGEHAWVSVPPIPGAASGFDACRHCGERLTFAASSPRCLKAPREPHRNQQNLAAQIEADFALKLGAAWGLRTDPARVAALAAEVRAKHARATERYQKKGWVRADGSEDQSAVKRAVAGAYGASVPCLRCGGTGKFQNVDTVPCRGAKERGRYRGCLGSACAVCRGRGVVEKPGSEVTCKVVEKDVFAAPGEVWGCDGTGYDLSVLPMLPRTEKLGVSTDRDTKMESGDDDLADYGEDEWQKSLSTYLPYLQTGVNRPLSYSPNVIVKTGRCSLEGSPLHQMPRKGKERECIRARGAWCGSPVEYVLGSTDYEAGELCTLFQLCYWLFGYSRGRDAINASGKPGILHSDLAAEVLGVSLDEFLKRLKAKDKQAIDLRQGSKPNSFGTPGYMGVAKLVLTNRKKNAGFTVCERGPATNENGEPGYWGVRFCILTGHATECGTKKLIEWKGNDCAPVCEACVRVVDEVFRPAYFRRYPEIKDYFKWAKKKIERHEPAPVYVWDAEAGAPKVIRERGGCDLPAYCNHGFQAMLSDVGKHAFVRATRECYLGVRDDGSPSPLAGCRLPLYLHDEPLSELIADTAHLSGPRIAEIMMESGQALAPDVVWRAESALAFWWNKSMEPKYENGKLVPWGLQSS